MRFLYSNKTPHESRSATVDKENKQNSHQELRIIRCLLLNVLIHTEFAVYIHIIFNFRHFLVDDALRRGNRLSAAYRRARPLGLIKTRNKIHNAPGKLSSLPQRSRWASKCPLFFPEYQRLFVCSIIDVQVSEQLAPALLPTAAGKVTVSFSQMYPEQPTIRV